MTERTADLLAGLPKVLKDADAFTLTVTATIFWVITAAIGYFDPGAEWFTAASQTTVEIVASLCTVWASINFFSARHKKNVHRRTLRNLVQGSKNHLIIFFGKGYRVQTLHPDSQYIKDLIYAGILEYVNVMSGEFRMVPDYWELLHDEGEKLLFSGKQRPSVPWQEGM